VHIQPGASRNKIVGPHGDCLKIKISAPPVDGKANSAIQEYLSEFFGIAKSKIQILAGETGRKKSILINADRKNIEEKLKQFLP
jgi:uncharacterized protein (TIGR00251 family)